MKERLLDVMKIGLIIIIVGAVFYALAILLKRDPLTLFSMWLTALATIAIAICALFSYRLASKIQSRDEEFRRQIKDLYQAIVISVMIHAQGPTGEASTMQGRMKWFKEHYKGKTPILD